MYIDKLILLYEIVSPTGIWLLCITIIVLVSILLFQRFYRKEHKPLSASYSNIMAGIDVLSAKMGKLDDMGTHFLEVGMTRSGFITPGSPYELTQDGHELLKASGALSIIEQKKEEYFKEVFLHNPRTPGDLEKVLSNFLYSESEKSPLFIGVKSFVYNNPMYPPSKPISIFTIIDLMTIFLRDKYLKEHPEFPR